MIKTSRHARTRGANAALLSGIWEGRPLGQTLLSLVLTAGSIPLLLEAVSAAIERPYTFHVNAKSEVLTLTTEEVSGTGWYLENARARQESPLQAAAAGADAASFIELPVDPAPRTWESFTGYVEVGPHARVTLTRRGSGPLSIHIAAEQGPQAEADTALPAAVLKPLSGDDRQASRNLELQVRLSEQPLNGTLQGLGAIGGDPYSPTEPASPPLLRTGEVSVVGRRLGSELLYTVMAVPLRLGDEVRVLKTRATPDTPGGEGLRKDSAAFICTFSVMDAASDGTGIDLACHASGRSLVISRFGARIGALQPRPWDVLANEPSMQAILPLGLTALFALFHRLLDSVYPRLCGGTNRLLRRLRVKRSDDHPRRRWAVHRRARRERRRNASHEGP